MRDICVVTMAFHRNANDTGSRVYLSNIPSDHRVTLVLHYKCGRKALFLECVLGRETTIEKRIARFSAAHKEKKVIQGDHFSEDQATFTVCENESILADTILNLA